MPCPSNTARSTGNYFEKLGIQSVLRKQPAQLEGENREDEVQGVVNWGRGKLQGSEREGMFFVEQSQGERRRE